MSWRRRDPRLKKLDRLYRQRHPGEARRLFWIFLIGHFAILFLVGTLGRRVVPDPLWRALAVAGIISVYALVVLVLVKRGKVQRFAAEHRHGEWFGLCLECGYDLRGSLAAGKRECPECGAKATTLAELAAEAGDAARR